MNDTQTAETARELDLDRYLPALLTWVNNKLAADASRIYRAKFGVGIGDWRVLAYLGVMTDGTGAEMSDFLGMDKAAISRSLTFLGDRDYVTLAQQQGRRSRMKLTENGVRLYNSILDVALKREEKLLSGFSDAEHHALLTLMHRMHDNIPKVIALYTEDGH